MDDPIRLSDRFIYGPLGYYVVPLQRLATAATLAWVAFGMDADWPAKLFGAFLFGAGAHQLTGLAARAILKRRH